MNSAHSEENNYLTSVNVDIETNCWGCGLRLLVSPHASVFKCGWCGAITKQNEVKATNKSLQWRRYRDRFCVSLVLIFMLFFICGGIWALYPVIFSISYFCGVFHFSVALILSIATLSAFSFSAFRPASFPTTILWGSYPTVGKGGLENYSFCHYCSRPKSPRTHHCQSCQLCILDMDHHCPFIGNCVGAANHRYFILFLITAVTSTLYATIMSSFAAFYIWPPLNHLSIRLFNGVGNAEILIRFVKEYFVAALSSAVFLPARGVVLVYLFICSLSVGIGSSVLLWQQLWYIYSGKTYLNHLSAMDGGEMEDEDCQNLVRFFGSPSGGASVHLPSLWKSGRVIRSKAL